MGATYTPPGGGSAQTLAPDWAADSDAAVVAGDWVSASTLGAATGVYKATRTLGLRMRTDKAVDGATDTDGDRVQGLLHAAAAGDWVIGLRVSFDRPGVLVADASTALAGMLVFVDGTGATAADDSSWYGIGNYWSGVGFTQPSLLRFSNTAGASRFETYGAFATLLNAPGVGAGPYDVFFVRTGTALDIYMGPIGGAPALVHTYTVTAGAGYIGLRIQHQLGVAHDLMATIMAYRDDLAEVPW